MGLFAVDQDDPRHGRRQHVPADPRRARRRDARTDAEEALISIRAGTADDAAAIRAIDLSAGELFRGTHMDWAVGDTTPAEDVAEAAADGMLWVADESGAAVGYLLGEAAGAEFHIWEVAVRRDRQGQGIGRRLLDAASAEAAACGFARATLTTDRTLPWNAPWYRRCGFAEPDLPSPRLAAQLASEPNPQMRCAMVRALAAG